MFTSPAVSRFNQDNADVTARKPGTNTAPRRPFVDRSVNGLSPIPKSLKQETTKPQIERKLSPAKSQAEKKLSTAALHPDDDLIFYDIYSFKDIKDDYSDIICPMPKDNILRFCCQYDSFGTPPYVWVTPCLIPVQCGYLSDEDSDHLSDEDCDLEESVEEVSLPSIEFEDSDDYANATARKPGANTVPSRSFVDQSVNRLSPVLKNLKHVPTAALHPDHDGFFYDMYSFKDIKDDYSDIMCPMPNDNILHFCCQYDMCEAAPPYVSVSPCLGPKQCDYFPDEDENCNLLEEHIDNVSMPSIEFHDSGVILN